MKINLSRLPVKLLGAYAKNVITVSEKPAYTVVSDHVLLNDVKENYADFFAVFGKQGYSGMGEAVKESDLLRDQPFRAIKSILKGFVKVSGYQYRQDASDLLQIIENLSDKIDELSYNAENESLNKLIAEFDKTENTEKLAHLNLTVLYDTLKTRHAEFMTLYLHETEMNAGLRQQESPSSLHSRLCDSLRNYLGLVTAMKMVAGWSGLYAELTELSKAVNKSFVNDSEKDDTQKTTE